MFWRAVLLLILVAGASIGLTMAFGAKVLLALGLILAQLKVIGSKLVGIELPAVVLWLKAQANIFFKIELLKKWFLSTFLPLLMGPLLRRKIVRALTRYKMAVKRRYAKMLSWYRALEWYEKTVAALIMVFATLGLSVSSLGLWLILFSVKLPFWVIAASTAFGRMMWASISKMIFKTLAFLQLEWAWKLVKRSLPQDYIDRKRRWDFRVARAVVRQRRLTVRQLHDSKHSVSMRLALIRAYFRTERPKIDPPRPENPKRPL